MNDGTTASTPRGWFDGLDADDGGDADAAEARRRIREGSAEAPADWPTEAVESGFADDADDYYARLREATIEAAREAATERERADDRQLVHAVRSMDDAERVANELAERVSEWAGTQFEAGSGVDYARELAERDPEGPDRERVVSLAGRVADLADEADDLRTYIEQRAPTVAPNLTEMAGPVLAARLMSLAGGLDSLAKKPAGTVQVLGAEDALFAHLRGRAPSPKHGIIFTHEFVRGTRPEDRGSAARAFAGKLALAARADHYAGERRPQLHEDLRERMETIRARAESDGEGKTGADGGDGGAGE